MRVRIGRGRGKQGSPTTPLSAGNRLVGTLFFGVFLAAGLFFSYFLISVVLADLAAWGWDAVPARIVRSEAIIDDGRQTPYRFEVLFEYDAGPDTFRATTATIGGESWTDDFRDVQRLLTAYPAGAAVTAYASPEQPGPAVLVQSPPWMLIIVPLPLVFVAIGGIGVYAMWTRNDGHPVSDADVSSRAVGQRYLAGRAPLLFFGVFALVGAPLTWFLGVAPLWQVWQAQSWPATPAVVERSELLEHRGSDSRTYRIDILYRYTVDGQAYRSNAYNFARGSSSGRDGKAAVVRQHPVGHETVCYVDPTDASQAVLNPKPGAWMLFGLIPLAFLVVGVGGLLSVAAGRVGASTPVFPSAARRDAADDLATRVTLNSGGGRRTKCIVLALVALVWTGFSGAMWVMLFRDGEWFGLAFLSLFVLVGLGLCVAAAMQFLALFNPHVRLTLPAKRIALGETVALEWELTGNTARLRDFAIVLEGQERATYQQGTDTRTDTHTFLTLTPLLITDTARIMDGRGQAELTLPMDTMHGFKSRHNEVRWTLKARGKIHRWPDVDDEWEIEVAPLKPGDAAHDASVAARSTEASEA